jgi:hypothetical protein
MGSYCDWWIGFRSWLQHGLDQEMEFSKRLIRHLAAREEFFDEGGGERFEIDG